jgi:hypothetical protein
MKDSEGAVKLARAQRLSKIINSEGIQRVEV